METEDMKSEMVPNVVPSYSAQTQPIPSILLNSNVVIPPPKSNKKKMKKLKARPMPRIEARAGELLDGFALVGACGVELPEDVESVVLTSQNFVEVEVEDLHHFTALAVLDVGDNRLPGMDVLQDLPALRELRLQCNHLHTCNLQPGTFAHLELLDMSYNHLDSAALQALGALPRLRELDLSCNSIGSIPAGSFAEGGFARLQTLHLGAQSPKLQTAALAQLATLPALRALRIPANGVRRIDASKLPPSAFKSLGLIDLSSNSIEMEDDIMALGVCPVLQKVVLWGNPLARLAPLDMGNEVPLLGSQHAMLVLRKPENQKKPPLRHLYAHPLPAIVDGNPLDLSTLAADTDAIEAAFTKVHENVKGVLGSELRAEEVSGGMDDTLVESLGGHEEEEEDDSFFLTGVKDLETGIPVPPGPPPRPRAYLKSADPSSALLALKFALAHPLVEGDGNPPPRHIAQTTISVAKKKKSLRPLDPSPELLDVDPKAQQIQTIEGILASMKSRLASVENNLLTTAKTQAEAETAAKANAAAAAAAAVLNQEDRTQD